MSSNIHRKGVLLNSAKSVGIACTCIYGGAADSKKNFPFAVSYHYVIVFSKRSTTTKVTSEGKKKYSINVDALPKYVKQKNFTPDIDAFSNKRSTLRVSYTNSYVYNAFYINPQLFTWTSGNRSIATVDKKGNVKMLKPEDVTITAKLKSNPKIKVKFKLKWYYYLGRTTL